jgi:hypothetical protein
MSKVVQGDHTIHVDVSKLESGASGVTACGVTFSTRYTRADGIQWVRGMTYAATHRAKPCQQCADRVRVAEALVLFGAAVWSASRLI